MKNSVLSVFQVGNLGKLSVIMIVWMALVILTLFYCYFCEQRLFPKQRILDWGKMNAERGGRALFKHRRDLWDRPGSIWASWISPSLRRAGATGGGGGRISSSGSNATLYTAVDSDAGVHGFNHQLMGDQRNTGELKFREFKRLADDDASPLLAQQQQQQHFGHSHHQHMYHQQRQSYYR